MSRVVSGLSMKPLISDARIYLKNIIQYKQGEDFYEKGVEGIISFLAVDDHEIVDKKSLIEKLETLKEKLIEAASKRQKLKLESELESFELVIGTDNLNRQNFDKLIHAVIKQHIIIIRDAPVLYEAAAASNAPEGGVVPPSLSPTQPPLPPIWTRPSPPAEGPPATSSLISQSRGRSLLPIKKQQSFVEKIVEDIRSHTLLSSSILFLSREGENLGETMPASASSAVSAVDNVENKFTPEHLLVLLQICKSLEIEVKSSEKLKAILGKVKEKGVDVDTSFEMDDYTLEGFVQTEIVNKLREGEKYFMVREILKASQELKTLASLRSIVASTSIASGSEGFIDISHRESQEKIKRIANVLTEHFRYKISSDSSPPLKTQLGLGFIIGSVSEMILAKDFLHNLLFCDQIFELQQDLKVQQAPPSFGGNSPSMLRDLPISSLPAGGQTIKLEGEVKNLFIEIYLQTISPKTNKKTGDGNNDEEISTKDYSDDEINIALTPKRGRSGGRGEGSAVLALESGARHRRSASQGGMPRTNSADSFRSLKSNRRIGPLGSIFPPPTRALPRTNSAASLVLEDTDSPVVYSNLMSLGGLGDFITKLRDRKLGEELPNKATRIGNEIIAVKKRMRTEANNAAMHYQLHVLYFLQYGVLRASRHGTDDLQQTDDNQNEAKARADARSSYESYKTAQERLRTARRRGPSNSSLVPQTTSQASQTEEAQASQASAETSVSTSPPSIKDERFDRLLGSLESLVETLESASRSIKAAVTAPAQLSTGAAAQSSASVQLSAILSNERETIASERDSLVAQFQGAIRGLSTAAGSLTGAGLRIDASDQRIDALRDLVERLTGSLQEEVRVSQEHRTSTNEQTSDLQTTIAQLGQIVTQQQEAIEGLGALATGNTAQQQGLLDSISGLLHDFEILIGSSRGLLELSTTSSAVARDAATAATAAASSAAGAATAATESSAAAAESSAAATAAASSAAGAAQQLTGLLEQFRGFFDQFSAVSSSSSAAVKRLDSDVQAQAASEAKAGENDLIAGLQRIASGLQEAQRQFLTDVLIKQQEEAAAARVALEERIAEQKRFLEEQRDEVRKLGQKIIDEEGRHRTQLQADRELSDTAHAAQLEAIREAHQAQQTLLSEQRAKAEAQLREREELLQQQRDQLAKLELDLKENQREQERLRREHAEQIAGLHTDHAGALEALQAQSRDAIQRNSQENQEAFAKAIAVLTSKHQGQISTLNRRYFAQIKALGKRFEALGKQHRGGLEQIGVQVQQLATVVGGLQATQVGLVAGARSMAAEMQRLTGGVQGLTDGVPAAMRAVMQQIAELIAAVEKLKLGASPASGASSVGVGGTPSGGAGGAPSEAEAAAQAAAEAKAKAEAAAKAAALERMKRLAAAAAASSSSSQPPEAGNISDDERLFLALNKLQKEGSWAGIQPVDQRLISRVLTQKLNPGQTSEIGAVATRMAREINSVRGFALVNGNERGREIVVGGAAKAREIVDSALRKAVPPSAIISSASATAASAGPSAARPR